MTVLEKQGLVDGHWLDPRKRTVRINGITDAGEQELPRLKAIIRPKDGITEGGSEDATEVAS